MKNIITVISLLAAGTVIASAADVTKIDFTNLSSPIELAGFSGNSVTVVALLDVEALKDVMLEGVTLSKHHLVELSGTLDNKQIGVTTNYTSGGAGKIVTSGLYGVGGGGRKTLTSEWERDSKNLLSGTGSVSPASR